MNHTKVKRFRKPLGVVLLILGVMLAIPGLTSLIYGGDYYDKFSIVNGGLIVDNPTVGNRIWDNRSLKAENEYDYVLTITVLPLDPEIPMSFSILYERIPFNKTHLIEVSNFNGRYEHKEYLTIDTPLEEGVDLLAYYTTQSFENVDLIMYWVRIYENPNRVMNRMIEGFGRTLGIIGAIFVVGGVLLVVLKLEDMLRI